MSTSTLTCEQWSGQVNARIEQHEKWIHVLFERVGKIEERITALEIPIVKEKMIEYLSEHPSATETELTELGGKDLRIASYYAFQQLKEKLDEEHHGRGRPITYSLRRG